MTVLFTEAWANQVIPPATVPLGALGPGGGLVPGSPDTWVMAGGYDQFPPADGATVPPSLFRVFDRRAPAEQIRVTSTLAAPAWNVIRGDAGTPVVDHAPGFAVASLISAPGLTSRLTGVPSGNGPLVLGSAPSFAAAAYPPNGVWNPTWPPTSFPVPPGEAPAGTVYEAYAWGKYLAITATGILGFSTWWSNTNLGNVNVPNQVAIPGVGGPADQARWRAHTITTIGGDGNAYTHLTAQMATAVGVDVAGQPLRRYVVSNQTPTPITGTGNQTWSLRVTKTGNGEVTVLGGRTWRAA
jgi:hypothetical protein